MLKLIFLLFPILAHAYPKSDHYDGERFYNLENNQLHSFWEVMKWKWTAPDNEWPEHVPNTPYPLPTLGANQQGVVTFINHASFLLQLQGVNVLTDPIFSQRASPFTFLGPKRVREPGVKLEELPKIDVVIISHNHYDHLDIPSLQQLDAKYHPAFLVPLGDEKLLKEAGIQNVKEMDWWEEFKVKDTSIYFAPSQHWSARGMFDKCKSLWGSYFIRNPNLRVYFGGDTGYASHFKLITQTYGRPDIALLPIGAYEPRWFMAVHHMNPAEAVKAHFDLQATLSIGMHLGTFPLTDEKYDDPIKALDQARNEVGLTRDQFKVLDQGESQVFSVSLGKTAESK